MSKSRSSCCHGKSSADGTTVQGLAVLAEPVNPAADWLTARFDIYGRSLSTNYHVGAMICLKSLMDAGPVMRVSPADYADPARVWL